jgi:hypothetical protein
MFARMFALTKGTRRVDAHHGYGADTAEGETAGLAQNTMIATAMGWRPAEGIVAGDKVLTFDNGLQTVTKVTRTRLWEAVGDCPREFWPLEVPRGVLGNREVMHLLPHQTVMIESDAAEDLYGDPFSLIPAVALEGMRGIHRVPPAFDFEVVQLHFAEEQVVFSQNGTLYLCASSRDIIDSVFEESKDPIYRILPVAEARNLAAISEQEIFLGQPVGQGQMGTAVPV